MITVLIKRKNKRNTKQTLEGVTGYTTCSNTVFKRPNVKRLTR